MRRLQLLSLFLVPIFIGPAIAQSSGQATTPANQTPGTASPGTAEQDRTKLCDGQPCETPDKDRDMQKLHAQDMDWLENYGPAAGGTPGDPQQRGAQKPEQGKGSGAESGHQGPGPH